MLFNALPDCLDYAADRDKVVGKKGGKGNILTKQQEIRISVFLLGAHGIGKAGVPLPEQILVVQGLLLELLLKLL